MIQSISSRHMRPIVTAGVAALLAVSDARAFNYAISAAAGGDGEASSEIAVSLVQAHYTNPIEGGDPFESYDASASGSGSLSASAASAGIPPFAPISHRAVARIEETIRLLPPPFPSGPVTVTLGMAAGLTASDGGGNAANALAQVQIEPFSETCSASRSVDGGDSGACPLGSVDGLSVTRTFSLTELSNRQREIDIAGQVETPLGFSASGGTASATATGALYATVTGGGVTSFSWSGTDTHIPAPEPEADALGSALIAVMAALAGRRSAAR